GTRTADLRPVRAERSCSSETSVGPWRFDRLPRLNVRDKTDRAKVDECRTRRQVATHHPKRLASAKIPSAFGATGSAKMARMHVLGARRPCSDRERPRNRSRSLRVPARQPHRTTPRPMHPSRSLKTRTTLHQLCSEYSADEPG